MFPPRAALLAVLAALFALPASAAAAPITPQPDAAQLGYAILANNTQLNTSPAETKFFEQPTVYDDDTATDIPAPTSGLFSVPFLGFPTTVADVDTAVLATGDVTKVENANQGNLLSDNLEDPVDNHGPEANDVTTLQLAVNVPGGANCVSFDYRFLSEEYPNYVGSSFNDAFIVGIDATDWSNANPYEIIRPHDIAADPAGLPVSVNGVGPTAMLPVEAQGTILNAATGLVTTKAPITSGAHKLYFSIFDAGDRALDSAVFIDNLQFISESPTTCKPPLAQQLAPPAVAPAQPSNNFTLGSKVVFGKGTTNVIVTVPAPGVITATDGSTAAASAAAARSLDTAKKKKKKKAALIKKTTVVATKAGPVTVTIKPTAAGKKVLKKKGKLKVRVRFTFTPTGGVAKTIYKTVTIKAAKKK